MQSDQFDFLRTDRKNVWHPFTSLKAQEAIHIEKGEGVYLITPDGRRIIDAISSWWVNLHGHSHPYISKALAEQAQKLEHVIFAGFTHEPAVRLIHRLKPFFPDKITRFFFSDDGSTSVEVGIKMAIQFWFNKGFTKKTKIIAWEGAYHGDTFGAMSAGDRNAFSTPFSPLLFEVRHLPFPDSRNHKEIISLFKKYIEKGDVASFIFEPLVQGAAGMRMYPPELLDELIQIAQENEVLCHADEVFTGFYRTGKMFATDYLQNKPDIYSISKGLTGGYLPMSITACSADVIAAFDNEDKTKTFYHGHSYTANPLACAVAHASLDLLMKDECQQQIRMINKLHEDFKIKIRCHPLVKEARVLGTIIAIELTTDSSTSYFNHIRDKIYNHFLGKNILLRPLGNVIYMVPPYVITKDELQLIYREIEGFLELL